MLLVIETADAAAASRLRVRREFIVGFGGCVQFEGGINRKGEGEKREGRKEGRRKGGGCRVVI